MRCKRLVLFALLTLFLTLAACQSLEPPEEVAETEIIPFALDPAVVQGMAEFTSATEQFSLRYPADWVAEEDVEGGVLVIANTEAALARFNAGQGQMEAGDFALNIGFVPAEFFELMQIDVRLEGTPKSLLLQFILSSPMMRARSNNTVVSDIKIVSFAGEREAALVMVSDDQSEGAFMVIDASQRVVAFISALGYPAEFETFSDTALTIAATVEFKGDSEALWAAMLGL